PRPDDQWPWADIVAYDSSCHWWYGSSQSRPRTYRSHLRWALLACAAKASFTSSACSLNGEMQPPSGATMTRARAKAASRGDEGRVMQAIRIVRGKAGPSQGGPVVDK